MNRYDARENAFAVIFSSYFQKSTELDEILSLYLESQSIESDDYFESLVRITYENLDAIDTLIEKNLNNWKISRISKVALAALRIGITELCYVDDTPDRVAINEAIELAKKYEDQKCGNFVNGILSAILKAK